MNIEEIMKPYFDKKQERENKKQDIENQIKENSNEINHIELRLKRLELNKATEIEDYVRSVVSDRQSFSLGYADMIRRDLEQEYSKQEDKLRSQMEDLQKQNVELENELSTPSKYYRLDVREMVELKGELRQKLVPAKKQLELQLQETQLMFDTISLKMRKFEYIYDENHVVQNGSEFKKLFDQSNELIDLKYSIQNQLKKLDEYLELTQLTEEEIRIGMMAMTPWEREEWDRRKASTRDLSDVLETPLDEIPAEDTLTDEEEEILDEIPAEDTVIDEEEETLDETPSEETVIDEEEEETLDETATEEEVVDSEDQIEDDKQQVFETEAEMLESIFDDIFAAAKQLRSVKLSKNDLYFLASKDHGDEEYRLSGKLNIDEDKVQMPTGEYFSQKDIQNALKNYVRQNKGRTFKVKELGKTFKITSFSGLKLRAMFRDSSIRKLILERKIGEQDVVRVYGKDKAKDYYDRVEIGEVKTTVPEGEYVNLAEVAQVLKSVVVEKGASWIQRIKDRFTVKEDDRYYGERPNEELEEAFLDFSRRQR